MTIQLAARIANDYLYEVGSFTYQNLNYDLIVDQDGVVTSCNCPDHIYRHRACKHMKALQSDINARKAAALLAEKRAQDERIQQEAQAIVSARFSELEQQRDEARKYGGFSILA